MDKNIYHCVLKHCEIRPSQDCWRLEMSTVLTTKMLRGLQFDLSP
jgi:hypothetical protein